MQVGGLAGQCGQGLDHGSGRGGLAHLVVEVQLDLSFLVLLHVELGGVEQTRLYLRGK